MDPTPVTSRINDSRPPHVSKVSTDLRLVGLQNFHKEANTYLVAPHQVQQPKPCAIGESFEEGLFVECFRSFRHGGHILSRQADICLDRCPLWEDTAGHIRVGICRQEVDAHDVDGLRRRKMSSEKEVQALKAHLAINVKDVETSIEFYKKLFGIEPSKVRVGYAKFNVENPPLNFTLNQVPFNERGALSHLGIQVASTADVHTTRQRWIESGLVARDEMQTSCCYALQDKTWVRDPDGNEWEVFVVLKDNLQETAACECGDKVSEEKAVSGSELTNANCCAPTTVGITHDSKSAEASCC